MSWFCRWFTWLVACCLAGGGCTRDLEQPPAALEYHGEPSSMICGRRWSHDVKSFSCEHRLFRLREMAALTAAQSAHLYWLRFEWDRGNAAPAAWSVALDNVQLTGVNLGGAFPRLRSFLVVGTPIPAGEWAGLAHLEGVILVNVVPPKPEDLVRAPVLKRVALNRLRCGAEVGCDLDMAHRLLELRPDLEVSVNGERVAGPGPAPAVTDPAR